MDLLVNEHQKRLAANIQGIDYRKLPLDRPWPFHAFAEALGRLLGQDAGLSAFSAQDLEVLKKFYNRSPNLSEPLLKEAFESTHNKTLPYLIHELGEILKKKEV